MCYSWPRKHDFENDTNRMWFAHDGHIMCYLSHVHAVLAEILSKIYICLANVPKLFGFEYDPRTTFGL